MGPEELLTADVSSKYEKTSQRKMQSGKLKTTFFKTFLKVTEKSFNSKKIFFSFLHFIQLSTFFTTAFSLQVFDLTSFVCKNWDRSSRHLQNEEMKITRQHSNIDNFKRLPLLRKVFQFPFAKLCDQFWNSNTQMATTAIVWLDTEKQPYKGCTNVRLRRINKNGLFFEGEETCIRLLPIALHAATLAV